MSLFSKKDQKKVNEKFDSFKQSDFNEDDTKTVLDHEDDILKKCTNVSLAKFLDDIKTMCAMVKAWVKKRLSGNSCKNNRHGYAHISLCILSSGSYPGLYSWCWVA